MPETFLILFAGGILLAAAISNPNAVTIHWLRLCGILSLSMAGLAIFFYLRRDVPPAGSAIVQGVQKGLILASVASILGQLAFVQINWRCAQRAFAGLTFMLCVLAGSHLLHEGMIAAGTRMVPSLKAMAMLVQTTACAGVAAMSGLVLMDMFLGHAYLNAANMTIQPFRRLNATLGGITFVRAGIAVGVTLLLNQLYPVHKLWAVHGLYILTRWLVGLMIPMIFLHMAHDCIKRRSTQSATGILYVAGVLILIGEIVALHLVHATGLPF